MSKELHISSLKIRIDQKHTCVHNVLSVKDVAIALEHMYGLSSGSITTEKDLVTGEPFLYLETGES